MAMAETSSRFCHKEKLPNRQTGKWGPKKAHQFNRQQEREKQKPRKIKIYEDSREKEISMTSENKQETTQQEAKYQESTIATVTWSEISFTM